MTVSVASGARVIHAHVLSRFVGQSLRPFLVSPKSEDLVVLTELIEAGKVMPVIDRTYPPSETPEASLARGLSAAPLSGSATSPALCGML